MKKNKIIYFSGILASQLGSNLFIIAMIIWLKQTQSSVSLIGLFLFCSSIANLVISPFAGVWVDRLSSKNVMIFTDVFNGLIMIIISLLMSRLIETQYLVEIILTLTFLSSSMTTAFGPASLSLIGQISTQEEVKTITSWASNITQSSSIIGRSIAGVLVTILSPALLIMANGISFLLSALLESQLVLISVEGSMKNKASYFSQLKEGVSFLKGKKLLISLFIGAAGTNFFMAINAPLMPTLIKDILGHDLWWYGVIMSASGVGALLGGHMARKISKETTAKFFSTALVCQGLPFAFIPLSTHPISLFLLIMIVGFFYVFVQVNILTIVTRVVPAEFRGRIFSLMFAIVGIFMPISYLISGGLADMLKEEVVNLYYISGFGIPLVWCLPLYNLKNSHKLIIKEA